MSQDDIWDDSALIASWEEAVAEYKVGLFTRLANSLTGAEIS